MRKAFRSLGLDTQGFVGRSSFLYPDYQYLFTRVFARVHDSSSAIPPMGIARMDGHGDTSLFFSNGARMFVLMLAYGGIPLLAGWLASELVGFLSFGVLGVVSYFPLVLTAFLCPFLILSSINNYLQSSLFSDCWDLRRIFASARSMWPDFILPVIAFWGIVLLGLPLYGLSFFVGAWVLLAYSSAMYFGETNDKSSIS